MELIHKKEACEILSISHNTLDALMRKGKIPFYRIGPKTIRLDRAEVEAYLEASRVEHIEPPKRIKPKKPHVCTYVPGMKVV